MQKGLIFFLLFSAFTAFSQTTKRFDYGISMGVGFQRLNLKAYDKTNLTVPTIQKHGNGIDLLVMGQYKFNKNLALRVMPGFMLQDFELLYQSADETHLEKRSLVEATLPIHITYTWQLGGRILPSFIAGANMAYNIDAGNEKNRMAVNHNSFGVDIGLGGEIKFSKFSMRPELIYTFGNTNMVAPSNSPYNSIIRSLTRDRVTFRLIFFG
jgi:Outer membrane protein beta-barrel domain